jgi:hypothetical protein
MAELEDETIVIDGQVIGVNDFIRVKATQGKSGFIGKVKGWWIKDGEVITIDVWGGSGGREQMRSLRLDKVEALKAPPEKKKRTRKAKK